MCLSRPLVASKATAEAFASSLATLATALAAVETTVRLSPPVVPALQCNDRPASILDVAYKGMAPMATGHPLRQTLECFGLRFKAMTPIATSPLYLSWILYPSCSRVMISIATNLQPSFDVSDLRLKSCMGEQEPVGAQEELTKPAPVRRDGEGDR
eukprot:4326677-Pleurochrysis_carterae.AAC.1